jgi:hypothetical protein
MLRRCFFILLVLVTAALADTEKPVFPGADWEAVPKPEDAGYSSARLEVLRMWLKTHGTTAMMAAHDVVVVHKVDRDEVREENYVGTEEYQTMLQMVLQSACNGKCF